MPPKKHSQIKSTVVADSPTGAKRAKTIRPSELWEVAPAVDSDTPSHSQRAIQSALSADNLVAVLKNTGPGTSSVVSLVEDEVSDITQDTNLSGIGGDPSHFTSHFYFLPVFLWVFPIWANEDVDFGALLFSSPQHEGKYLLSMMPSGGSQPTPQLTLEPSHSHKKIVTIHFQSSERRAKASPWCSSLKRRKTRPRDLASISGKFQWETFFLEDVWETSDTLKLYTDSAGSLGFGAVFGRHWFYGLWPVSWQSYNI